MAHFTKAELHVIALILRQSSRVGTEARRLADKADKMAITAPGTDLSEVTEQQDVRKYPRTEAESISPSERTDDIGKAIYPSGEPYNTGPLTVHIPEEKAQALADELERILDEDLVNGMLGLNRSSFKAGKRWDNKDQGAGI